MTVVGGFKFRSVRGIFLSLTLIVVFANDKKSVVHTPSTNSSLQTNDILRTILSNRLLSRELRVTTRNNQTIDSEKNGEASREDLKAEYVKSTSGSTVDERRRNVAYEDGTLRRRDKRNFRGKQRDMIRISNNTQTERPADGLTTGQPPGVFSLTEIISYAESGILLILLVIVCIKRKKIDNWLNKPPEVKIYDHPKDGKEKKTSTNQVEEKEKKKMTDAEEKEKEKKKMTDAEEKEKEKKTGAEEKPKEAVVKATAK